MEYTESEILKAFKKASENTLMETLDIEFVEVGEDFVTARMPVTPKVHQPDGVLHGGASVALAETVGSFASFVFLEDKSKMVRGIEISANHVKGIREGYVYAKAQFLHKGRTTQLWDIKVRNEEGQLISSVKLTTITLPRKDK